MLRLVLRRALRLALPAALLVPAAPALAADDPWGTPQGRTRVLDAMVGVFRDHYWDPDRLDWSDWAARYREAAAGATSRPAFDLLLSRMVDEVGDDHSSWVGLVAYAGEPVPVAPRPTFGLRFAWLPGEGAVLERVLPGTPARDAGLRRGDVVLAVDGVELGGLEHVGEARERISAAERRGGAVLRVRRGPARAEPFEVRIVARAFDAAAAAAAPWGEMLDARTGYLQVPSFRLPGAGAAAHVEIARLEEAGARMMVLDLRGNDGGRLGELGLLLGAFVDGAWGRAVARDRVAWEGRYRVETRADGPVGVALLVEPGGREVHRSEVASPARFDGPLVVLVDGSTASAGEIAALALRDRERALLVGERTPGNVEALRGFDLPDGSLVMVAVAEVQSADGTSFGAGVRPDLPATARPSELARGYDAAVAAALRSLGGLPLTPGRWFGASAPTVRGGP